MIELNAQKMTTAADDQDWGILKRVLLAESIVAWTRQGKKSPDGTHYRKVFHAADWSRWLMLNWYWDMPT